MKKDDNFDTKYKVIVNGKTICASLEEAQKLIEDHGKRNHLYSLLDETWKIHDTIYLNDL